MNAGNVNAYAIFLKAGVCIRFHSETVVTAPRTNIVMYIPANMATNDRTAIEMSFSTTAPYIPPAAFTMTDIAERMNAGIMFIDISQHENDLPRHPFKSLIP